jgi:hypothetical protein
MIKENYEKGKIGEREGRRMGKERRMWKEKEKEKIKEGEVKGRRK